MSDTKEDTDQGGKVSPGGDKAKIDAKIHQFENGEREKVEREEKERKKALFERKLSKFDKPDPPTTNGNHPPLVKKLSHVDKMAKKFSYERKSEEEEREIRKRRDEFERKRSGFMSEDGETSRKCSEEAAEESRNRLSKMKLMFEDRDAALAAAEAEKDLKRRQEEEAENRRKEFEAKSSVFKKLSTSHDR